MPDEEARGLLPAGSQARLGLSRRRFVQLALAAGGIAGAGLLGATLVGRLSPRSEAACNEYLAAFAANVVRGGPPKDGIPSIDRPTFQTAAEAEGLLEPTDVVFGVVHRGAVRAYPQRILVWHEIVNDAFEGERVSITYCPLTGSPVGFLPPRDDPAETFGTSGNLVNSNLLMYDRVTDSRWPQILGTAITGQRCGAVLREIPVVWTTWARWRERHPDTQVLSSDTGFLRDYSSDPYGFYNPEPGGYYASEGTWFPVMRTSSRFPSKKVVYGLKVGDARMAIPHTEFRAVGVRNFSLAGADLAVLYDPALDAARVFQRRVEDEALTFEMDGGAIRDAGTGSTWSPEGVGLEGPFQGTRLEQVNAFPVMWFAWYAFYPDTRVLEV